MRLYLGTQEVMAGVALLGGNAVARGGRCCAQLDCAGPVAAVNRQPFVIRTESPVRTIGGGIVLQPVAARISRRDEKQSERLESLGASDDLARAAAAAYFNEARPLTEYVL